MSMRIRKRRAAARDREIRKSAIRPRRPALAALEWPEDVLGGTARLTALGSGRLMVENHLGIVELTRDSVKLMTRQGVLAVRGEGLALADARAGCLVVEGALGAIEFPQGSRKGEPHA